MEPTTSLDVTIQEQIIDFAQIFPRRISFHNIIFITHDLGVVASIADMVAGLCMPRTEYGTVGRNLYE